MPDIPIIQGFVTLFSGWGPVFFALHGTVIGLLAGALPGLSGGATIALLIPLTARPAREAIGTRRGHDVIRQFIDHENTPMSARYQAIVDHPFI